MTMDDLPHFQVSGMRQTGTGSDGTQEYQISGRVDRAGDVKEGPCYLLVRGEVLAALSGNLKFLGASAGTAEFYTSEESMPDVTGADLVYLEPRYNPLHVFMVAEPRWKWVKDRFQALDAISRRIEGQGTSIVDGEEVKDWIEIRPVTGGPQSRCYPVFPSGRTTLPPLGEDGLIKAGWDHTHCELCDDHIDAGAYAYVDLGKHWVCEKCYHSYVVNHDLSFL